jgi:hypothetical protein
MTMYTNNNFNEISFNEIIIDDIFQFIHIKSSIYVNVFQIFILIFIYAFLVINTPVIIFVIITYELFL